MSINDPRIVDLSQLAESTAGKTQDQLVEEARLCLLLAPGYMTTLAQVATKALDHILHSDDLESEGTRKAILHFFLAALDMENFGLLVNSTTSMLHEDVITSGNAGQNWLEFLGRVRAEGGGEYLDFAHAEANVTKVMDIMGQEGSCI